jgi:hypothetical protein
MCACVPPPPCRIARRALKTRVKQHWLGSSDTPTLTARVPAPPPPRQISKKDRNIEADLQFFLHTCATVLTHWLYDWLNN